MPSSACKKKAAKESALCGFCDFFGAALFESGPPRWHLAGAASSAGSLSIHSAIRAGDLYRTAATGVGKDVARGSAPRDGPRPAVNGRDTAGSEARGCGWAGAIRRAPGQGTIRACRGTYHTYTQAW